MGRASAWLCVACLWGCTTPVVPETDEPVCGDGTVDDGEACDDGNNATEGCDYGVESCTVCDATCQSVAGVTSYCGDDAIDTTNSEVCDDGGADDGDGCDALCQPEAGPSC